MVYLVIVSFIWAFSFGLIKGQLTDLDPNFVSLVRMVLAFLVFAPFLRRKAVSRSLAWQLIGIGAIQFGVMYVAYIHSYRYLPAYQVALYTVFTPLYVTLIGSLLKKRLHALFLVTSLLAVAGAYIVLQGDFGRVEVRAGFLILQASNLAFAFGQVAYKRVMSRHPALDDHRIFGLLYLGALLVTAACSGLTTDWAELAVTGRQVLVLLYLGLLPSGVCFFLWNHGAKRTDTGALAILNNLKVPLAVVCSLVFFGEECELTPLLVGGGILLVALGLNERFRPSADS